METSHVYINLPLKTSCKFWDDIQMRRLAFCSEDFKIEAPEVGPWWMGGGSISPLPPVGWLPGSTGGNAYTQ